MPLRKKGLTIACRSANIPFADMQNASVAQSVEQLIRNQQVGSSSLPTSSIVVADFVRGGVFYLGI